jgi:hypothetical protein
MLQSVNIWIGTQDKADDADDINLFNVRALGGSWVRTLWQVGDGGRSLALAQLAFSTALFYLLNAAAVVCWVLPRRLLSPQRCANALLCISLASKFTLFWLFVLPLAQLAVALKLVPIERIGDSAHEVDFYLRMRAGWCLYCAACVVAVCAENIALACARRRLSAVAYVASCDVECGGAATAGTWRRVVMAVVVLSVGMLMLYVAFFVPLMRTTFAGPLGDVYVDHLGYRRTREVSASDLLSRFGSFSVPRLSDDIVLYLGALMVAIMLTTSMFVAPLLLLCVQILMLTRLRSRVILTYINDASSSCQALDVVALAACAVALFLDDVMRSDENHFLDLVCVLRVRVARYG